MQNLWRSLLAAAVLVTPAARAAAQAPDPGEKALAEPTAIAKPKAEKKADKTAGGKDIYATFETSAGNIVVKLLPATAPKTVESFTSLAEGKKEWTDPLSNAKAKKPLYDNTIFHRVIPGFMIQGGDPLGDGTGGPGYTLPDEGAATSRFDRTGMLAMATACDRLSAFSLPSRPPTVSRYCLISARSILRSAV